MTWLFSKKARTDPRPCQRSESAYEFFDRVDQPFWKRLRDELEIWFERYAVSQPNSEDARRRFRGAFTSGDDRQHEGATWELYLHELFVRAGFRVIVEPEVLGKTPDFLLEQRGEPYAYVEAAVDFVSDEERASGRRLDDFIASVEANATIPDTALSFLVRRRGSLPLPGAHLGRRLVTDYQAHGHAEQSTATGGWNVSVELQYLEGHSGRFSVSEVTVGGTYAKNQIKPVRTRLKKKGDKYKELDLPLIVAINVLGRDSPIGPKDVAQAMYGSITTYLGFDGEPLTERAGRDGTLGHDDTARRSNVSGVLFAQSFSVAAASNRAPAIYLNRLAKHPVSPEHLAVDVYEVGDPTDEPTQLFSGADPSSLFQLPSEWPGPEAPFSKPYL